MNALRIILIGILALSMLTTPTAAATAKVILTFDDGWKTTSTNALPILQNSNQKGVVFLITDPVYRGYADYMSLADLQTLNSASWDISSHTVTHPQLTTLTPAQLSTELNNSKQWLDMNGFVRGSMFLSYPEGLYNDTVIQAVKSSGYVGARTVEILNGTYPHYILNDPTDAQYKMKTFETDCTTPTLNLCTSDGVITEINNSISQGGLLIITFHKIVPSYSGSPSTEFLSANLQNVSTYLNGRSAEVDVVTLSEYFGAVPTPTYIPPIPANLMAITGSNWIKLNWTAGVGDNKTDTFNLRIDGAAILNGTIVTEYNITSAVVGKNYFVQVNALNGSTMNPTPAQLNVSIPTFMPATPTNLTATMISNKSIRLNWTEGTGGNKTDYYRVFINYTWYPNATSPNITFNATPGLNYAVEIFAVNQTNIVTMNVTSAKIIAQIPVYSPRSPTNLTATVNGTDPIKLNWTEGTGGNKTDYYRVFINYTWYPNATSTNFTFNATPGVTYPVSIYAVNTTNSVTMNQTPATIYALIPLYMPPPPAWANESKGNFWVYVQWKNGTGGNRTDFYNYSVNGNWTNQSTNTSVNVTTVPHGKVNVTICSGNSTNGGVQNPLCEPMFFTMDNNYIEINGIWGEYDRYIGDLWTITPIIYNPDNDPIIFSTNASLNHSNVTINATTGVFNVTPADGDEGTYHWNITARETLTGGFNHTIPFTVHITKRPPPASNSGGGNTGYSNSGSGGGSSGGGTPTYNPNTDVYERRDSQIRNKAESKVVFARNPLIYAVTFNGIRNYGEVTVTAATLKKNPEWQNVTDVYKYFSITLDAIQQQNEYLYLANATVDIFINNSDLSGNTLKAYRFYNGTYNLLEATELKSKSDANRTYFRLISSGLSNFAIALESKNKIISMPEQTEKIATASILPVKQMEQVSQKIQETKESLYRMIINLIKKYMPWI